MLAVVTDKDDEEGEGRGECAAVEGEESRMAVQREGTSEGRQAGWSKRVMTKRGQTGNGWSVIVEGAQRGDERG